jgi:alpha-tubulin suppressor-like RCC1 family protein
MEINQYLDSAVQGIFTGPLSFASYFLTTRGTWYVIGQNEFGQLGLGHQEPCDFPTEMKALAGKNINKIFTYHDNSIGYNQEQECPLRTKIATVKKFFDITILLAKE